MPATLPSPSTAMVASMWGGSRWMRMNPTVMPDCSETTGSRRPVSAPAAASCACTAASLSTPRPPFICAVKSAVAASYSPACMWSSRRVAIATASASPSAAIAGIAAGRPSNHINKNDCRYRISVLLLEAHAQCVCIVGLHDRDQFPTLYSNLLHTGLLPPGDSAAEQLVGQFHHLVLPAFAHGLLSFFPVAGASFFGRRPALRSDSRSTYSIWALRLRNSSSAQRCAAASTSALMRSG